MIANSWKMSPKSSIWVGVTLVVLLVAITVANAGKGGKGGKGKGEKGGWANMNWTCKGEALDTKKMFAGMENCKGVSTTPATGDEKKGKWGERMCMKVCMWKEQKILDSDGKYSSSGAEAFIKSVYPASVVDDIKKGMDTCASDNGSSFSMDKNCEGYKKFKGCSMKKAAEVCGWKMGKGGKGKGGKGKKGKSEDADADSEE